MNRWRPLRPIRTEEHDPETNKLVVKIDVERRSREELEAMSLDIPDTTMGRAHKKQQEEVQPKRLSADDASAETSEALKILKERLMNAVSDDGPHLSLSRPPPLPTAPAPAPALLTSCPCQHT